MSATQARGVGPRRCCTYVLKVYCAAHGNFGTQDEQRCFKPGTSLGSISRAHMHLASALPRAERRPGVGQGVFMERVSGGQYEGDRAAGLSPVRAQPLSPRSSAATVTRACRLVLMHACTSIRGIPAILASTSTSPNTLRERRVACRGRSGPRQGCDAVRLTETM